MLLSIIMPVYNAEKYLKNSIESILSQSFTDFELILVDDGSKDSSPDVCDAYAQMDTRVKVIHQDNAGPSKARNAGIKAASGAYIEFVDSDDRLIADSVEAMAKFAESTGADILLADAEITDGSDRLLETLCFMSQGEINVIEYLLELSPGSKAVFMHYIWNRWYKRELFISNDLCFDEEEKLGEDFLLNCEIIKKCKKIYSTGVHLYQYYKRENDSLSGRFNPNELNRRKKMDKAFIGLVENYGIEFNKRLKGMIGAITLASIKAVFCKTGPKGYKEKFRYIESFLTSEYMDYLKAYSKVKGYKSKSEKVGLFLLTRKLVCPYIMVFSLK